MTASDERVRHALYGSERPAAEQALSFREGEVPVAVYGLGKMGLPLATVFADVTGNVVGADVDPERAAAVGRGACPVAGEPGLPGLVESVVSEGALRATSDPAAAAADASLHVVVVPTVLGPDDEPDLSALEAAVADVGAGLDPGDAVFVECTVPPGTCRDVVVPGLAAASGRSPDEFGVAACPERTASGRALEDIRHSHPKVVGGVDAESTRVAELVYDAVTTNDVLAVDAATAEAVKVFEGVYRDVNIALANELARFTEELGVDVNEAIRVANTQPYCDIHAPGPGVGGHCIPFYPHFLLGTCDTEAPLLATARERNDAMPAYTVDCLAAELDRPLDGATVLVLGLSYRAGVAELRKSPGVDVARELAVRGARVVAADPLVGLPDALAAAGVEAVPVADLPAVGADAAVVTTADEAFTDLDWSAFDPMTVVDGRQALSLEDTDHRVYTLGSGRA